MSPLTQAIARDLVGYALGEPDEDRLPEIYKRLAVCSASRRFVNDVRAAGERLADDLEPDHSEDAPFSSRLTLDFPVNGRGAAPKAPPPFDADPDFDSSPARGHFRALGLNGAASSRTADRDRQRREPSSPDWLNTFLIVAVIFLTIQCIILYVFLARGHSPPAPPRDWAERPSEGSVLNPQPRNPGWLAPNPSAFRESPKSMTLTVSRPRWELPPDLVRDGNLALEDRISRTAVLSSSSDHHHEPPEAAIEFRDAPWSPNHRLVLVRILAARRPDGSPPLVRIEFNPKQVRSYRHLSHAARLPWVETAGSGGGFASAFLVEIELNEATGDAQRDGGAEPRPHDRETLFLTLGHRDAQGQWRGDFEQTATDGPDLKTPSPSFQASVAVAAWRLLGDRDPLMGSASPYLVRQLADQAPSAARSPDFLEMNREVPDDNATPP